VQKFQHSSPKYQSPKKKPAPKSRCPAEPRCLANRLMMKWGRKHSRMIDDRCQSTTPVTAARSCAPRRLLRNSTRWHAHRLPVLQALIVATIDELLFKQNKTGTVYRGDRAALSQLPAATQALDLARIPRHPFSASTLPRGRLTVVAQCWACRRFAAIHGHRQRVGAYEV
jgi:hypothetical protein